MKNEGVRKTRGYGNDRESETSHADNNMHTLHKDTLYTHTLSTHHHTNVAPVRVGDSGCTPPKGGVLRFPSNPSPPLPDTPPFPDTPLTGDWANTSLTSCAPADEGPPPVNEGTPLSEPPGIPSTDVFPGNTTLPAFVVCGGGGALFLGARGGAFSGVVPGMPVYIEGRCASACCASTAAAAACVLVMVAACVDICVAPRCDVFSIVTCGTGGGRSCTGGCASSLCPPLGACACACGTGGGWSCPCGLGSNFVC